MIARLGDYLSDKAPCLTWMLVETKRTATSRYMPHQLRPWARRHGFGTKRPGLRLLTTKVDHNRDRHEPILSDSL